MDYGNINKIIEPLNFVIFCVFEILWQKENLFGYPFTLRYYIKLLHTTPPGRHKAPQRHNSIPRYYEIK